jgi:HTH-type transcriptional regulator, competence development regulator
MRWGRTRRSNRMATHFGQKVRELRKARGLSQRALAAKVQVTFGYISKIETDNLDFGDYPSEAVIRRLAEALLCDPDQLLLLAEKVPERIRRRVLERPDAFGRLAELDDATLDRVLQQITIPSTVSRR